MLVKQFIPNTNIYQEIFLVQLLNLRNSFCKHCCKELTDIQRAAKKNHITWIGQTDKAQWCNT